MRLTDMRTMNTLQFLMKLGSQRSFIGQTQK